MLKKYGLNISLVLMALIVIAVGMILVFLLRGTNHLVSDMLLQQSETANLAFREAFQDYQNQAFERAAMIAASEDIINAVADRNESALSNSLQSLSAGMDLITLCDADGIVLTRTHSDKKGDSVLNQQAISAALTTGTGISTIEPGTVIGLSTRGSTAIKDHNGKIIGALTCGHDLSQPKYVDVIKKQNNCEATFFAGDERMNTTLIDEQGNRVIGTNANDQVIEIVLNQKQDFHTRVELFGKMYQGYYSPVTIGDQAIGMLFTGVQIEDALSQERNMIVLIIFSMIMLLLAVFITTMVIRWIAKKIYWYESMLDSIPFPISVTDMNRNWTFINRPVEQMLNGKRADMLGKPCSTWGAGICKTDNCGITCLENGKPQPFLNRWGWIFRWISVTFWIGNKDMPGTLRWYKT